MYSNLDTVFMLWASLLTPNLCSFYISAACDTLVMLLSLRGDGFGLQLPSNIGFLVKTFLLAPSVRLHTLYKTAHSLYSASSSSDIFIDMTNKTFTILWQIN